MPLPQKYEVHTTPQLLGGTAGRSAGDTEAGIDVYELRPHPTADKPDTNKPQA